MSAIGPHFVDEITAAGLNGLSFGWSDDGTFYGLDNLTEEQQTLLQQVIEAHDPDMPALTPLRPAQFWGVLRATGYEQDVRDWVDGIDDPTTKSIVSAKLEFSERFHRNDVTLLAAQAALEISNVELDALWVWAMTL